MMNRFMSTQLIRQYLPQILLTILIYIVLILQVFFFFIFLVFTFKIKKKKNSFLLNKFVNIGQF